MPRPRNIEQYERISKETMRQLLTQGYSATSYASIAAACETTRAIVQDYFPQKSSMAMLLTNRLYDASVECTAKYCSSKNTEDDTVAIVAHLYASALAFFEFMQADAGRRKFLCDILKDRDNTETWIFNIMARSFDAIGRIDVTEDPAYRDDLLMSLGGFFELFYYHLKEERPLDIALYYAQVTRIWLRTTGYPKSKLNDAIEHCAFPEEDLEAACGELERMVETHIR